MPDDSMPDDVFARLTSLERAQWLYDAAQRRHVQALDRQQATLDDHAARMAALEHLLAEQQRMQARLLDVSDRLQTTLEAIKDLLGRSNGH